MSGPNDYKNVTAVKTEFVSIPPGATVAVYLPQIQFENSALIKYFSGGSFLIVGCTGGATLASGDLASLFAANSFYMLGTSEALALDGPCRFYMMAIGATANAFLIRSLNA